MIIQYYGHSMFQITLASGKKILIDPFDQKVGYPIPALYPDYICTSHQHSDHNNVQDFSKNSDGKLARVFEKEGTWYVEDDLKITLIPTFHDDKKGTLRGNNLFILIEAEGLNFLHLGDLGEDLTAPFVEKIGEIDILCVPVGGYYTIDAVQASRLCKMIAPQVIIPMHYKTEYNPSSPITTVESFLDIQKNKTERLPLLRITKGDLTEQPSLALLNIFIGNN